MRSLKFLIAPAGLVVGGALLALWLAGPGHLSSPHPASPQAAPPEQQVASARHSVDARQEPTEERSLHDETRDSAIAEALAPLPPEDAEWVLDEAERYRAARAMDDQAMAELVAQLASVRMHDVIERTEPMMPRDPGAP